MEVARALLSQNPGESESCLSLIILASLLATTKKPPQDHHTASHTLKLFYCHSCKSKVYFFKDEKCKIKGASQNKESFS